MHRNFFLDFRVHFCAPGKPRALPQRSCSDVTGSGNPAYPDVTAPRRAALRRGEAVGLDARRVQGGEVLELNVGRVFQAQRDRRKGVAVLRLSLPFHPNVFSLLLQSLRYTAALTPFSKLGLSPPLTAVSLPAPYPQTPDSASSRTFTSSNPASRCYSAF